MPDDLKELTKQQIAMLLEDYKARGQEILDYSGRYFKLSGYLYLALAAIVSLAAAGLRVGPASAGDADGGNLPDVFQVLLITLMLLAPLVAFYLIASGNDALYMMYLNGFRRAMIEKVLNHYAQRTLLVWDSRIMDYFQSNRFINVGPWVRPAFIQGGILWLFTLLALLSLGFLARRYIGDYLIFYGAFVSSILAFLLHQWLTLNTIAIPVMISKIEEESWKFISRDSPMLYRSSERIMREARRNAYGSLALLAALLTITLGTLPMMLGSIVTDTLWPRPELAFPFVLNMSVLVGDTLIIPFFNYFACALLAHRMTNRRGEWVLYTVAYVPTFIVLIVLSGYTHLLWAGDPYFGFMDRDVGRLTVAGWWHAAFSAVQLTIVLAFLLAWARAWWSSDQLGQGLATRALVALTVFTFLSPIDTVIKWIRVFPERTWKQMAEADAPNLVLPLLVGLVLLTAIGLSRTNRSRDVAATVK